ncbi:hypothetical protein KP509_04G089400 [Ceratopteris richardii]|uniref:EF-hand domain-containing protein n=1 Tax=Ceratopteris richardii TaxID=49495 RepID=A0A8T2V2A0_CERRI|nr:hypothetical protein KP509_04G089400 [Ceratopteris richardii]
MGSKSMGETPDWMQWGTASGETGVRPIIKWAVSSSSLPDLYETFKYVDTDNSDSIDLEELKKAMRLMGFNINDEEIEEIFRTMDTNHDDMLSFEEFVVMITQEFKTEAAFNHLCGDKSLGTIKEDDIKTLVKKLNLSLGDEDIANMYRYAMKIKYKGKGGNSFDKNRLRRLVHKLASAPKDSKTSFTTIN